MDACQVNLGAVSAAGQMPEEEISFCVAWSSILISEFQDCAFRQDHGIHSRYCYFQRQNCCCGWLSRFRKGQLERSCARQGIHSRDIYLEWNSAGRPGELTKPHCLWCLRVGGLWFCAGQTSRAPQAEIWKIGDICFPFNRCLMGVVVRLFLVVYLLLWQQSVLLNALKWVYKGPTH